MTYARASSTCAMLLLVGGAVGCSVGTDRLPVDERPLAIVDASSRQPIDRVLVVPRYGRFAGVSWAAPKEAGTEIETDESAVESPFVYQRGSILTMSPGRARGLYIPMLVFAGRSQSLEGVTLISPSYRALWFYRLDSREASKEVELEPLSEAQVQSQRTQLIRLFQQGHVKGADMSEELRLAFALVPDMTLQINLTSDERKMVLEFVR